MNIEDRKQYSGQLVSIHKATEEDSKDIWIWRNDEKTRKMFTSTEEVSWEAHKIWYDISLKNKNRYLFVGILEPENKI